MRKALVLFLAVTILAATAFQLPEGITGFFVQVSTSVITIVKEVVKTVLITIANML